MASGISQIGFYFVNGIANTDGSGSKATEVIQEIMKESSDFKEDATFVAFQPNDSAPTERMIMDVALVIAGLVAVTHSLNKELKKQGNNLSRIIGFAGACAIVGALYDYKKMQDDKNKIAETLAMRVSTFLNQHDSNIANLIFHSQGADVGYRSLELLSAFKGRIRVVTLGAMTTIPMGMCDHVKNYKFSNDWISRVLALPFEEARKLMDQKEVREVIFLEKEGALAHGVRDYLEAQEVKNDIIFLLNKRVG